MVHLRPYKPTDATACFRVFRAAVQIGAAQHYTQEQRDAWAPDTEMPDNWPQSFENQLSWVATRWGRVNGFMTMGYDGHVDLAFVSPDYMGRGIGLALYRKLEAAARNRNLTFMTTEASLTAKPLFERQGWQVEARQSVIRNGVILPNYRMYLILN
ncbi:GNAT family N-acetyltransferase [Candidatus Halocynthiibacter alkanivorans]|uniref:GNAT family N-acetyltransferase n=1 Tax=Candidatus Halocynthiibacter alkanivorans TaxID=2267619 RepID=UPI000DF3DD08|nr:GNAT family N-acetyltransferase [Candidatus Halocynthiibacter alkanivorans]